MSKFLIFLLVLTTLISLSEFQKAPKNPPKNPPKIGPKNDRCHQTKVEGKDCGGTRWWYVAKEKVCKPFQYKGCGGNQNNFDSFASCQKACKGH
uniref:BPTI/Kunitz inhibitor domain-containing protein n=2 Tax=Meloidogyne TaxID=189290 RepID=A0A914MDL6_MELIC|nr:unnamed protein product [Meloidogyne enterolobii]